MLDAGCFGVFPSTFSDYAILNNTTHMSIVFCGNHCKTFGLKDPKGD